MHNNRIYLRELRSVKNNNSFVSVEFKKGLNIISGASNTGKSYILECIDYLFGASKSPRDIGESLQYEYLLLEIETSQNEIYTLKRFFNGKKKSKVFLFNSSIDQIANRVPKELNSKHSENSISAFLLNLMGLNEKKLLDKIKTGQKVDLSLRILSNFLIVDETRIIEQKSPVYRDPFEKNKNSSAFKFLLSGNDDSNIEKALESPEIYRSKLNAKIDFLNELISKATANLKLLGEKFDNDKLDNKVVSIMTKLKDNTELIKIKTNDRNSFLQKGDSLNDDLIEQERLLSRYTLLQEHYENDVKRIDFVEEGGFYLNQLENVPCPICQSKTIPQKEEFENVIKSCNEESHKVISKIKDLDDTIKTSYLNLNMIKEKINVNEEETDKITYEIEQELKPINEHLENSIAEILEIQKKVDEKEMLKSQLVDFTDKRTAFQKTLEGYKESNFSNEINLNYYKNFGAEISNILTKWKYKEDSCILFDEKALDITINGEPRINQGKGHRAITYAAFTIGLMKYTNNNNLNNAGFVVLDSPLLNLKEKATSKEDELSEIVQKAFWANLADTPEDEQIIIIENKEPDEKLKEKINFVRFTGDDNEERKGFY